MTDGEGDVPGETLGLGDGLAEGETDGDGLALGETLGLGDGDGLGLTEGLGDGLADAETDGDGDGVAEGVGVTGGITIGPPPTPPVVEVGDGVGETGATWTTISPCMFVSRVL